MQMELTELRQTKCPGCSARPRTITRDRQHVNGHWFESMVFECGCSIHFVPNFMRTETSNPCPNTPKAKSDSKQNNVARGKLLRYIQRLDAPLESKKKWFESIVHTIVPGCNSYPGIEYDPESNT